MGENAESVRRFIRAHIERITGAIEALGGKVGDVVVEQGAPERELLRVEEELGRTLPVDLRIFASTISRKIEFSWQLSDDFELPEPFREIFSGGLDYDISAIPDHEEGRSGWEKACFPDTEDPYEVIWHDKLGIHHVPNGDYLGMDAAGRVIYLSHDDGEGHGFVMARSLMQLMERWLPLGCPGPEDWQWMPFVSGPKSGISSVGHPAELWFETLGLGESRPARG